MEDRTEEEVKQILKKPYSRAFMPEEDGGYSAYILEFSGCYAEGDTLLEAYDNLENAAESWLLALPKTSIIPETNHAYEESRKLEDKYTGPPKIQWGATINSIVDPYFNELLGLKEKIHNLEHLLFMCPLSIYTCHRCPDADCSYRYDHYNTNGDCLKTK